MTRHLPRQAGATLVELMVALVIGTVIVLALMIVTSRFESGKRQSGAATDLSMAAGNIAYDLDRQIRSAGSGYLQSYPQALGCTLNVSRTGVGQVLPGPAAFPAPFATVPQQVRLMPFLIHAGLGNGGSDVLAVMSGTAGVGKVYMPLKPAGVQSTQLSMMSTVGLRRNDMLLLIENNRSCLMTQVGTGFTQSATSSLVPLGGLYYAASVNGVAVSDYALNDIPSVLNMGNASDNPPQLTLYGIDGGFNLQSYDLLQTNGNQQVSTVLTNIVNMRALYGVDTNGDGKVDLWVKPTTSGYRVADLTAGTAVAQSTLANIRAVRIGLILRSDRIEAGASQPVVSASTVKLFSDLGSTLEYTHTVAAADQYQRFRAVDFTVPLRNALLLPSGSALTTQVTP